MKGLYICALVYSLSREREVSALVHSNDFDIRDLESISEDDTANTTLYALLDDGTKHSNTEYSPNLQGRRGPVRYYQGIPSPKKAYPLMPTLTYENATNEYKRYESNDETVP